jgi:hypothetical protein
MVHVPAGVVADGGPDTFGKSARVEQQPPGIVLLKLWEVFERRIQLGHIGRVMLIVMQHHGLRVDVGLERRTRIRQRGK